jgi:hypothetical protein
MTDEREAPSGGTAADSAGVTPNDTRGESKDSPNAGTVGANPQETSEAPAAEEEVDVGKGPTVVKRVVCSYHLGWLPGEWLQTWRRLDRVFARANLRVKATLAPLEDLPTDTDILVVPPELRDDAREAAPPGTPILVTPASAAAAAFADLVARLEAGTDFTAEKFDPEVEKTRPKIVSYRGHTILD